MKIRCIIVDDEPLARKGLREYIDEIEFLELVQECKNAVQANDVLQKQEIDLLFLDIQMPLLTGLDFLRSLSASPHVIFTTAYSEYALDGYAFDVIDFLVKPISFERFLQAANKAHRVFARVKQEKAAVNDAYIFVKSNKVLRKIDLRELRYVEAMQNYVTFHVGTEAVVVHSTIKQVLELLPREDFVQVHKSYVVSKNQVDAIDGNQVVIGKHKVPISTRLRKDVLEILTGG